jgi:iron-sulfur cluster assembly accessory protein
MLRTVTRGAASHVLASAARARIGCAGGAWAAAALAAAAPLRPTAALAHCAAAAGGSARRLVSTSAAPASGSAAPASVTSAAAGRPPQAADAAAGSGAAPSVLLPTAKAVERLRQLAAKSGNPRLMLRIAVYEGGCHGMEYKFQLEQGDAPLEPDDTVIDAGVGARFVLDAVTVEKMRGSTVDFLQDLQGEMFAVVHNPLAVAACGCGSSFSPTA